MVLLGPMVLHEPIVGKLYIKRQRYHHPFISWFLLQGNQEAKRTALVNDGSLLLFLGRFEKRKGVTAKMFQHDGEVVIVYSDNVWEILDELD
jgi:hypothetical protein